MSIQRSNGPALKAIMHKVTKSDFADPTEPVLTGSIIVRLDSPYLWGLKAIISPGDKWERLKEPTIAMFMKHIEQSVREAVNRVEEV